MLHPGSCKQSVPPALAIFDESTIVAILSYFPKRQDAAGFLQVVSNWWIVSNSKQKIHGRNRLGNAGVPLDNKPQFLRALADWITEWQECKLPNCERFQLSAQTSDALTRTLRCRAALIEDLLETQQYEYVLTARFQSDPLEKRYGQYRQMSGGRFLVSLREVRSSEKILKLKSLIKAGCDFADAQSDDSSKTQIEISRTIKREIEKMPIDYLVLDENSREVATYVAGFIAKQTIPYTKDCCGHLLVGESEDDKYIQLMMRGGLQFPSQALCDYVCSSFAVLDAINLTLMKYPLKARFAAEIALQTVELSTEFFCDYHKELVLKKINRTISNVFYNNERKSRTAAETDDKVREFKR